LKTYFQDKAMNKKDDIIPSDSEEQETEHLSMMQEENQEGDTDKVEDGKFKVLFLWITLSALLFAVLSHSYIKIITSGKVDTSGCIEIILIQVLVLSLGLIGAATYVLYRYLGKTQTDKADSRDHTEALIRLLVGASVSWVFYFAFGQGLFSINNFKDIPNAKDQAILVLPFLAGFSTELVIGIIGKLIDSVKAALGIVDKK